MEFTIRTARPEDLEVCIAFDCTDPTDARGDEEKVDHIRSKIGSQEIYLAVTGDKHPVGYLTIDRMWPMMMPLVSWVYVAPAWRKHGIAHQLFDFCLKDLKQRKYKRILISTQSDRDQMLAALRGDLGLKEIGTLQANPDDAVGEVFFVKDIA